MAKSKKTPQELKWKRGQNGRPETKDGRFHVEHHWNQKPGYYVLVDTLTFRRYQGTKLRDLKGDAQAIVDKERQKSSGLYDNHMNP